MAHFCHKIFAVVRCKRCSKYTFVLILILDFIAIDVKQKTIETQLEQLLVERRSWKKWCCQHTHIAIAVQKNLTRISSPKMWNALVAFYYSHLFRWQRAAIHGISTYRFTLSVFVVWIQTLECYQTNLVFLRFCFVHLYTHFNLGGIQFLIRAILEFNYVAHSLTKIRVKMCVYSNSDDIWLKFFLAIITQSIELPVAVAFALARKWFCKYTHTVSIGVKARNQLSVPTCTKQPFSIFRFFSYPHVPSPTYGVHSSESSIYTLLQYVTNGKIYQL